ncbi:hypothetical protein CC2G_014024 [Coprinopsis cinerea AmutBmut pab1-1]|nr:hypothetical protein CC2G_014024 [Coprinopsis cinerea AmutBmut pab1-1]
MCVRLAHPAGQLPQDPLKDLIIGRICTVFARARGMTAFTSFLGIAVPGVVL